MLFFKVKQILKKMQRVTYMYLTRILAKNLQIVMIEKR